MLSSGTGLSLHVDIVVERTEPGSEGAINAILRIENRSESRVEEIFARFCLGPFLELSNNDVVVTCMGQDRILAERAKQVVSTPAKIGSLPPNEDVTLVLKIRERRVESAGYAAVKAGVIADGFAHGEIVESNSLIVEGSRADAPQGETAWETVQLLSAVDLAQLYSWARYYEDSIKVLDLALADRSLRTVPSNYLSYCHKNLRYVLWVYAAALQTAGRYLDAIRYWDRVVSLDVSDFDKPSDKGMAYHCQAQAYSALRRRENALASAQRAHLMLSRHCGESSKEARRALGEIMCAQVNLKKFGDVINTVQPLRRDPTTLQASRQEDLFILNCYLSAILFSGNPVAAKRLGRELLGYNAELESASAESASTNKFAHMFYLSLSEMAASIPENPLAATDEEAKLAAQSVARLARRAETATEELGRDHPQDS